MLSLPIPEPGSPITYGNSLVQPGLSFADVLGQLGITQITKPGDGKLAALGLGAHLDPDLRAVARPQPTGWQPLFGQSAAAQQHLARQGVAPGDVFVFFGWFRDTEEDDGQIRYSRRPDREGQQAPLREHARPPRDYQAIWGWMEIGEMLPAEQFAARHPWAIAEHPHLIASLTDRYRTQYRANSIYMASPRFSQDHRVGGAGVLRYSDRCLLTMPGARSRRWWALPDCFHPRCTARPMTYHPPGAWSEPADGRVILRSACIGQEFVVPINDGIASWLTELLTSTRSW